MPKLATLAVLLAITPSIAHASTYCYQQYEQAIANVNTDLSNTLRRTEEIQNRLRDIFLRSSQIAVAMAEAAAKIPPDIPTIQTLGLEQSTLTKEKTQLEAESYALQDHAVALKGTIPADLQGKLRGCVEATAPVDQLVNLTIQVLAILSTGGASLLLPPHALYVDMGAVLNGYPTGGSSSVVNQARESALNFLGIGGQGNDLGNAIKDPVGALRNLFGG